MQSRDYFCTHRHILQSIMGNFSYGISESSVCTTHSGEVTINSNLPAAHSFASIVRVFSNFFATPILTSMLHFNDMSSSLRFVTSQSRGPSHLPFEELVNIFDLYIWASTVIILTCASFAIAKLVNPRKTINMGRQVFSVLKCLLEQGDAFTFPDDNPRKVTLILAGVYLVSMLLSNAYKNNNVYNMILARKQLAYKTLDELQNDNFIKYSRLTELFYDVELASEDDVFQIVTTGSEVLRFNFLEETVHLSSHYLVEEGPVFIITQPEISILHYQLREQNVTNDEIQRLYRVTRVPSKSLKLLISNFRAAATNPIRQSNLRQVMFDLQKRYYKEEEEILIQTSKPVAVLLSARIAAKF